ncbi:MAG: hypothetical protein ABIJ16_10620, partial [Bacteroidota bacterium]
MIPKFIEIVTGRGHRLAETVVFRYLVLLAFGILVGWLKYLSVMECDQAQILLIARYNRNFFDMIATLGYEGSTGLWHTILWLYARLFNLTPFAATIIHYIIVMAFAWYLLFRVNLPAIVKMIVLTQLPLLWHIINVRQYIFVPLFMLVFLNGVRKRKAIMVSLAVFFMFQVHVTVIPVGLALWLFYLGKEVLDKQKIFRPVHLLPLFGLLLAALQLLPPADILPRLRMWHSPESAGDIFQAIQKAVVEMFQAGHTWVYVVVLTVIPLWMLRKAFEENRKMTILWLSASLFVFASFVFVSIAKYLTVPHYYLLLFVFLCLLALLADMAKLKFHKAWYILLIPLLVFSSYKMRCAFAEYLWAPFSYADRVAEYLDRHYPHNPVLMKTELHCNAVRIYRKHDIMPFALGRNEYVDFVKWNHPSIDHKKYKPLTPVLLSELRDDLLRIPDSLMYGHPVVLIATAETMNYKDDLGCVDREGNIYLNDSIVLVQDTVFCGKTIKWLTECFVLFHLEIRKPEYD